MQRLIIICFCSTLIFCRGQNNLSASKAFANIDTTNFKIEIPTYKDGTVDLFYKLKKQKATQLKLDSLESGYDSLEIRIWYDYALFTQRDLVVIKRTNSKWSGEFYKMNVNWNAFKDSETIHSNKMKPLTPKSGWDSFIKKILDLKIITLPNMDSIPGLQDNWSDGVTYNVEIATKMKYRFYGYHLPEKFENKYWQAGNMTKILSLISTELTQ